MERPLFRNYTAEIAIEWVKESSDAELEKYISNVEKRNEDPSLIWRGEVTMGQFNQMLLDEKASRASQKNARETL